MTKFTKELISIASKLNLLSETLVYPLNIRRLYPGHWQRSAGAWSWILEDSEYREIMGSCHTVKTIITEFKNGNVSEYRYNGRGTPELLIERKTE